MKLDILNGHFAATGDEGAFLAVALVLAVQIAFVLAPFVQRALERRKRS